MPERLVMNHEKNPRWRIVKPIPPLVIPKRILTESSQVNRSTSVMKNVKNISQNDNKDSYKMLLLIRELALAQEREEVLNASVSKEKEENLKISLDFSRTKQELNQLLKKEQSLSNQLRESSKIISHYEKEISALRDKKIIEKSSIGVGTHLIYQETPQIKNITVKSDEKNQADLDHFLKLCRQHEMSISVTVDQCEKLDSGSSISESHVSLSDQKIQVLNESSQVQSISEYIQTETPKKVDNIGVQTDDQSIQEFKPKIEATPEYLKFIMNAYVNNEHSLPMLSTIPKIPAKKGVNNEKSIALKDGIKIAKNPCFKTSPKNSICTCSKKSDSSKTTNESSQSNYFLLQDETSMLVPLQDLLVELEESYDTPQIYRDVSVIGEENDDVDDLSNLIEILNKSQV